MAVSKDRLRQQLEASMEDVAMAMTASGLTFTAIWMVVMAIRLAFRR